MLSVYLICVGRLKERFYREAAAEYMKRLSACCKLTVIELPEHKLPQTPSRGAIDAALAKEADAIRSKLPSVCDVVALCVEGKERSSEELSRMIAAWANGGGKRLVFVIGSSHGLHPSIKEAAFMRLSMSPMTFPHHLARVMVLEQLYRAFKIQEGSSYHK